MKQNLSAYLRQILALCLVLAGSLTFAAQAHCVTMMPEFTPAHESAHVMAHKADSQVHAATDDHHCHHENCRTAHANWAFLQQPVAKAQVPHLSALQLHPDRMLSANAQFPRLVIGNRTPPPDSTRAGYPTVLATTGRLLI